MPSPPWEFRGDVVRVAQSREDDVSLDQIARRFDIHPLPLRKWVRKADVVPRPGTTSAQSRELREVNWRVHLIKQEN
ncbi:transposase [Dietzia maris]|uniref:transposase n=1 Tax=Dietzia maris TaxID=37915 RepID=UPI0037C95B8C